MTTTTVRRSRTAALNVVEAEAPEENLNTAQLVAKFLEGSNGSSGDFHSADGALYEKKNIIARRASDGSVLLNTQSIPNVELNDQLMGQIFAGQRSYRRLDGFSNLTNPTSRTNELRNGQYDDFRAIASLFNFQVDDEDIAALERAKSFNARVTDFFTALQKEELDRIRSEEEKARAERAAAAAIEWDNGKGRATNFDITGAGGGQRLRLRRSRSTSTRQMVDTSHGREMRLTSAKRAFDFASRYWHANSGRARLTSGTYGITVTNDALHYGCQHVTRQEAERFADAMNWERARPNA